MKINEEQWKSMKLNTEWIKISLLYEGDKAEYSKKTFHETYATIFNKATTKKNTNNTIILQAPEPPSLRIIFCS